MKNIETISKIALTIMNDDSFESKIDSILKITGQHSGISRAYIFINYDGNSKSKNAFQWHNPDIKNKIPLPKDLNYAEFPLFKNILDENSKLYAEDGDVLPDEISLLLNLKDVRSSVIYPLTDEKDTIGFIGFDEYRRKDQMNNHTLKLLSTVSQMISNAYKRHLSEKISHAEKIQDQKSLNMFMQFFDNNPVPMAVSGYPDRKLIKVNQALVEKTGYHPDQLYGQTSLELGLFVNPDKQAKVESTLKESGRVQNAEIHIKCSDGRILDGLLSGEIIEIQGKKYYLTVIVDISEQKRLQNIIEHQRVRMANTIEGSRLGTWEWNVQTGQVIFNEIWAELIGYTLDELKPISIETWFGFAHPDDLKDSNQLLENHFAGKTEYYDIECRMKHKDGHWIWVQDRGKVIEWDESGKPLMMFGTHFEITEKKELENRIKKLSTHDSLTNAYNRRYVMERLTADMAKFKRDETDFSVSILDIDFFKHVNDNYGHPAGDYILKEFTRIISENSRPYDLVGRYGGEEFIIITYDSYKEGSSKNIERILEKIRNSVFEYEGEEIRITFSCGISDTSDLSASEISIEKLISLADKRLYHAKQTGRNKIVIYGN